MKRNRMTWMAAMLGMAAFTSLVGCGKDTDASNKGAATLNVHNMLQATDAKSAKVVVQGAAGSVNLTIPLVANATGTQWSAVASDLPIGSDYVFTATAYAADGTTVLYTGTVSGQSITKNQTANIVIDMNQVAATVSLYDEAPVIAGLTETASCVSKGDTVTIKATAYDTDTGDTAGMAWSWSVDATCGTLSAPVNVAGTDTVHGTSTVTFTATSSSANCQVNVSIADAQQPAVLMTTGSVTISIGDACAFGSAKITAIPNTCPVVANLGASVVPVQNTPSYVPMVVGQSTFVSVSATDADNDTLLYSWSSPDCATYGNWNDSTAKAGTWFLLTSAPPSGTCTFLVHVSDGTFADGKAKCDIVNHLSLPVKGANDVVKANPVFGYDYMSTNTVNDGDSVKLEIVAPTTGCDTAYTLTWDPAGTALTTLDLPFTTGITLTAAAGAGANGETVTVTATCPSSGLSTVHSFILIGKTAVCNGADDGTDCTSTAQLTDKCVTAAHCSAGSCLVQTSRNCEASTTACQDNVCGHTTDGLCHLQNSSDGTTCSDGKACTTADKCAAGLCGGTAVPCTPSSNPCMVNACSETANPPGCVAAAAPDGTDCSDGNGCTGTSTAISGSNAGVSTPKDQCVSGACVGGPAVTCSTQNDVCSSVTENTFSCGGKQCDVFSWANMVVPPLYGMGISPTATPWITGAIYTPFNFGTGTVQSSGGADMYLVKIDPATGSAAANSTFIFGDKNLKNQSGSGLAVASSGNVGVVGTFTGEIDFSANDSSVIDQNTGLALGVAGKDFLTNAAAIPFYAVFDGASSGTYPTVKVAHAIDIGTGAIMSIASNPSQDAIAICGTTSKAITKFFSTSGTGLGLPNAGTFKGGNLDLVVAKISASTGSVLWGMEYGGLGSTTDAGPANDGDQICESVAIDNSGNVLIAGNYSGDLFGLPNVADTTGNTGRLFMARLKAADGTLDVAASWGGTGVSHAPALTVDGSGNIFMGGGVTTAIDFGTGALAYTGGGNADAFVVKFNSSLAAQWAKLDGDASYDQTVQSVGADSSGNVIAVGYFRGTLPQFGLTAAGNSATDAFKVELAADGSGSTPLCAHAYGDSTGAQSMTLVAVARAATGGLQNAIFVRGALSGDMVLKTTPVIDLNTGSASTPYSFFGRASE